MNVTEAMPVGSVVKLKEATKRIVVIGILQQNLDGDEHKEYDYIGVPYPEGYLGAESMILFQQDDIEGVFSLGYSDVERQAFIFQIAELMEKRNGTEE